MKINILILILVLAAGLQAKSTSWKKLDKDELGGYQRGDYRLNTNVKCLEIRTYYVDGENRLDRDYWTSPITWCIKPYLSLDAKLMKRFRNAKPNLSRAGDIGKREASRISNAFVLDGQNKIWKMNMIGDVKRYLGKVDTLAEARLILWLNGKQRPKRYRKTAKGYEFLIEYVKSTAGCQVCKSSEICIEDKEIHEKAIVDKKGDIVLFQRQKVKILEQKCIEKIKR